MEYRNVMPEKKGVYATIGKILGKHKMAAREDDEDYYFYEEYERHDVRTREEKELFDACLGEEFVGIPNMSKVRELLEEGVDPNAQDPLGYTPLYRAVDIGDIDLVKLLLSYGADPDISDYRGDTPLHIAAYRGDIEMIKVLLEHGASIIGNDKGKTPIDVALERGHKEAAELLMEYKKKEGQASSGRKSVKKGQIDNLVEYFEPEKRNELEKIWRDAGEDPVNFAIEADTRGFGRISVERFLKEKLGRVPQKVEQLYGKGFFIRKGQIESWEEYFGGEEYDDLEEIWEEVKGDPLDFAVEAEMQGFEEASVEEFLKEKLGKVPEEVKRFYERSVFSVRNVKMAWRIVEKKENEAVLRDGDNYMLAVKCEDKDLARESGWYIRRIWNNKTGEWRDFSEPGWGETRWIKKEVAKELGLIDNEGGRTAMRDEKVLVEFENGVRKLLSAKVIFEDEENLRAASRIKSPYSSTGGKLTPLNIVPSEKETIYPPALAAEDVIRIMRYMKGSMTPEQAYEYVIAHIPRVTPDFEEEVKAALRKYGIFIK